MAREMEVNMEMSKILKTLDTIGGTEADLYWCKNEYAYFMARDGVKLLENDENDTIYETITENFRFSQEQERGNFHPLNRKLSVVVLHDYPRNFTDKNRSDILEGTIFEIAQLVAWIFTVITCMT